MVRQQDMASAVKARFAQADANREFLVNNPTYGMPNFAAEAGGSKSKSASSGGGGMSGTTSKLFEQAMAKYKPGGSFGKAQEALLARAKKKSLARGYQSAVSAGLGGTSVPDAQGAKFEEEVGAPTRAQLEDTRTQRLNELMMAQAGHSANMEMAQFQAGQNQPNSWGMNSGSAPSYDTPALSRAMQPQKAKIKPVDAGTDAGFRNLPPGGFIRDGYYHPPMSSFTRNVPTLSL